MLKSKDQEYFKNSCIVLTGATSGIGRAMVDNLISIPEINLILVGNNTIRCQELVEDTKSYGDRCKVIQADFSEPGSVEKLVNQIDAPNQRLILINNAGLGAYTNFADQDMASLNDIIMVNIYSLVMLTNSLMPLITKNGGGVLNISSVASLVPCPGLGVYGASKTFVTAFSDALRAELAALAINVVCYHPAGTESRWFERATGGAMKTPPVAPASAEEVATKALSALARNSTNPVHGVFNLVASKILNILPRDIAAQIVHKRTQKVLSKLKAKNLDQMAFGEDYGNT